MTAIAATPVGANRPEFTPSLGLAPYFPNPTGALLYSLGSAISSVVSAGARGLGWESMANMLNGRGYRNDGALAIARDLAQENVVNSLNPIDAFAQMQTALKKGDVTLDDVKKIMGMWEVAAKSRQLTEQSVAMDYGPGTQAVENEWAGLTRSLSDGTGGIIDIQPRGDYVVKSQIGKNKIVSTYRYNVDDKGFEYGVEDTLNGQFVKDGAMVRLDPKGSGTLQIVDASKIGQNAIVYVNGIRTGLKSGIDDMNLAAQNADPDQQRVYIYSKAKGTLYYDDTNLSPSEFGRAIEAGYTGKMKYSEPAPQALAQLLLAGKVDTVIAHSNGNNVALNTLYAVEQTLKKQGGDLSNVTYYGIAPNHNGNPMPQTMAENSAFFYHTNDAALKSSMAKPAVVDFLKEMFMHIPVASNNPVDKLRAAVKAANYNWQEKTANGMSGFQAHNVSSHNWAIQQMFR